MMLRFSYSSTKFAALTLALAALHIGCSENKDQVAINQYQTTAAANFIADLDAPFISSSEPILVQAHALIGIGKLDEAQLLITNFDVEKGSVVEAEMNCTQAELDIRLGDYTSAVQQMQRCRDSAKNHQDDGRMGAYTNHLSGYLEHVKGNYNRALAWYEKALRLSVVNESGNAAFLNTLNNLANVKYRLGNYDSAKSIHMEVLTGRLALYGEHHQKIAGTLGNLGNAHQASGMPSLALSYHKQALDIWIKTVGPSSPQLAYTNDNIGLALTELGRYEEALIHLHSAMAIKLKSQNGVSSSAASTHLLLADAYLGLGDIKTSKTHIDSSIAIFKTLELTNLPKYSLSQNTLAKVLSLQGNHSQAMQIIEQEIHRLENKYNPTISTLYLTKSDICYSLAEFECALHASTASIDLNTGISGAGASESLLLLKDARNSERLFDALKTKARSLIRLAELQRSSSVLNRAFETLENLITLSNAARLGLLPNGFMENQDSNLDKEFADFIDIGIDLLEEVSDEQLERRLFVATDMHLGGQLLSDLLSKETEKPAINPTFTSGNVFASSIPGHKVHVDNHSYLNNLLKLNDRLPLLENRSNISETFRLLNGIVLPSVLPGQSIVEYVNVRGNIIAFVINSEGVSTNKLGSISSINSNKQGILKALKKRDSDRFIELSVSLYEDLLAPISDLIGEDDLLIIPHDVASEIPFELLLSPKALEEEPPSPIKGLPYLIKRRSVSYGYSVAQIAHNADAGRIEYEHDFLGLAPVFDSKLDFSSEVAAFLSRNIPDWEGRSSKLEALPGTELEILEIADILKNNGLSMGPWGKDNVELYLRDAVSESEFKKLDLSSYRYVHLATHGFADREDPSYSGLLMETESSTEDDGVLFAHEVAKLSINSELVVLSSCETALEASPGAEITGLAKSFLYAGSQNVIASIWPSDDVGTRILMRILYAYMAEGYRVDQALRLAKLDLIEMGGPIANPYFWAGFIHIGAPSGIRKPEA